MWYSTFAQLSTKVHTLSTMSLQKWTNSTHSKNLLNKLFTKIRCWWDESWIKNKCFRKYWNYWELYHRSRHAGKSCQLEVMVRLGLTSLEYANTNRCSPLNSPNLKSHLFHFQILLNLNLWIVCEVPAGFHSIPNAGRCYLESHLVGRKWTFCCC